MDLNRNNLIIITGATGCFCHSMIVKGQTKSLGELWKEGKRFIDTISLSKPKNKKALGGYFPKRSISEIIPSGKKEVYEMELENGKKVRATLDHIFFKSKNGLGSFKECRLRDLKVGDSIRDYPSTFYEDFIKHSTNKNRKRFMRNHNPKRICKKCNNLFFINYGEGMGRLLCNTCSEEWKMQGKKRPEKGRFYHKSQWYEWEDNLIRQFYPIWEKEKILELMPHRTWRAILHRAIRTNIKRGSNFKWIKNAFTSERNPMHDKVVKVKLMRRMGEAFNKKRMTSIEKKVAILLKKYKIPYEYSQAVRTKTRFIFPDFVLKDGLKKRLVIECDGTYWHKDRKGNDAKKTKMLKQMGFEVVRFGEDVINNNFKEVEQCIIQKLSQLKK
jgi:very-short-patch-repair endonuclease